MHHVLEITFLQLLSLSNAEKAQNSSKVCLLQAGQHSFEFTQSFFFFFFFFTSSSLELYHPFILTECEWCKVSVLFSSAALRLVGTGL